MCVKPIVNVGEKKFGGVFLLNYWRLVEIKSGVFFICCYKYKRDSDTTQVLETKINGILFFYVTEQIAHIKLKTFKINKKQTFI